MNENRITYFAETDARNKRARFGIKAKDRTRHVYVIGKTGMGKSTMLENMAVQDIQNGEGMCFIDPHGKTADLMLEYVPKERIRDVIYIAPFDIEHPISFNVLESVDPDKRHLVSSGLMSTFKKIWEDAWSARMEYILTNTLLALLEYPGATLLGVNRMLSDKAYRTEVVNNIKDPSVKAFWQKEFANYTERQAAEAVPAIQNKVGQFTANPLIRNMIGQSQSSFDFREAIDHKKIVIINLSKGRIGDENMKLLGGLLVTKIYLAAMSRADVPDRAMQMLPNFYLYVDEFQNFANASFADILSEARKYKLNLTIAHQYVEQMDEIVRPAVFGNVGTMISFRVGASDAELLEKEFAPQFVIEDLVNLGFAQIYLKLMIDGLSSAPFSATTLPPISHPDHSFVKEIIAASREQFSRPRAEVEEAVIKFHNPVVVTKTPVKVGASSAATPAMNTASGASKSVNASATSSTPSATSASSVTTTTSNISSTTSTTASASRSTTVSSAASTLKVPTSISEKIPAPGAVHKPFADVLARVMNKSVGVKADTNSTVNPPASTAPTSVSASPTVISNPVSVVATSTNKNIETPKQSSTLAKSPIVPTTSTPSSSIVVPSEQKVVAPKPAPVKPVPLAILTPKPNVVHAHAPRVDPKVPTKQNVSDLKNALAAVLKKGPVTKEKEVKPKEEHLGHASQTVKVAKESSVEKDTNSPKEVPKDVLEKILNVD